MKLRIFRSRAIHYLLVAVLMLMVFNLAPASVANAAQSGDYVYTLSHGQATITEYRGWDSMVAIPARLGGYPVVKIGDYAFEMGFFTKVTIPDSVRSIGDGAFFSCEYLSSVNFGSGLLTIGEGAFYGCGLSKVTIPDSVVSIGSGAFLECANLTTVTLGSGVVTIGEEAFSCTKLTAFNVRAGNRVYASVNGVLFNKDKTLLIQYPAGKADLSYNIPGSVATIGDYAFSGCGNLAGVTIPGSVGMIDACAFMGCSKLATVRIGSGVTVIDESAFSNCGLLRAFTVSADNTVYASAGGVLFNKAKTKLMLFPAGKSSVSYTVPNGVTQIGDYAFAGCGKLASVTIPDSVTVIGESTFTECSKLAAVYLGSGLATIGEGAFMYCVSLTDVVVPDSVDSIGDMAFAECYKLTSAVIGSGVTSIGDHAFAFCESLTGIIIPDSVTSMGESVFFACGKLKSAKIGNGLTAIGEAAFNLCTGLVRVKLGSSVTGIGDCAFNYCESLKSITIPQNVTNIGYMAFSGCSSLSAAYFMGNAPKTSSGIFSGCKPGYTSYYLNGKTGFTTPWKGRPAAVFDPDHTYTVRFSLNGASGKAPATQTMYEGVKAQAPADPSRSSYTFSGWYTNPACTGTAWDFFDPVTSDTVLYAKWTPLPPATPSSIKAVAASYNSIRISWGASSYASGYEIYRISADGRTKVKIAAVTGTRTYTATGLICGKPYYYKVRAYRDTGTTKKYSGYSAAVTAKPVPAAPASVSAALGQGMRAKVSWSAVDGAAKYEVWRATSEKGAYKLIGTTVSTGFLDTNCTPGKTYYYKVRAFRTEGSDRVYGRYSSPAAITMRLAKPFIAANSKSYNSVRVEWNAITEANGYEVYRSTSADGMFEKVFTATSAAVVSHTDTGLATNRTYYYKVHAFQNVENDKVCGSFSAVVSARPVPSAPENITVERLSPASIRIKWDAVDGATKYEVRRCTTKAGSYAAVAETASTAYTDAGLEDGKDYYFKVRAYRLVGTLRVYGPFSAVASPT